MQEGFNQPSPKLRLKSTEGEIVEVEGGRVIRSLGRKDRHSKVCTLKGPRDRRVRLSAPIAIQFYDVQDRLGCDRPSKAIDWLIEKAKTAIDALAELPIPNPVTASAAQQAEQDIREKSQYDLKHHGHCDSESETVTGSSCGLNSGYYDIQNQQHLDQIPIENLSSLSYGAATPSSSIHLQNCPSDMNSRTINQSQSLRLSLESVKDSILLHHSNPIPSPEQELFSASTLVSNETPISWSDQQRSKMNLFQRMVACNWVTGNGDEEFVFNSLPQSLQQEVLSQDQLFSKREPLQSSNLSSIRPRMNLPISTNDNCYTLALNPPLNSGVGFPSDEYSGLQILSQMHGEEEQQNAVSN